MFNPDPTSNVQMCNAAIRGRFPRVFGDEFGEEFGDDLSESLNSVMNLVENLATNLVIHQNW